MTPTKTRPSYVLVIKEKHGDFYYPAWTDEELHKSAYKIVKERFDTGYTYLEPDEIFNDDSKYETHVLTKMVPDYDPEAPQKERQAALDQYKATNIDVIPDKEIRNQVITKLNAAIKREQRKRNYIKWYAELKRVIAEKDGAGAWRVLHDRSDYEYEGVELEQLQSNELDED